MQSPSIIICGSRQYNNIDLNYLVDSFDIIIRHNMLVAGCGYGLRDSTLQVMNAHVYKHYGSKISLSQWKSKYSDKCTNENHIEKFYKYINKDFSRELDKSEFIYYPGNNAHIIRNMQAKYSLKNKITSEPKCGIGSIFDCIMSDFIPFLIGYSIDESSLKKHQYNTHSNLYLHHDHILETKLICELHERKLVDASFCLLDDDEKVRLLDNFKPTDVGLLKINKYL